MKKKGIIIRIFLVTAILAIALVVIGQNNNNPQNNKKQLIERFERVIKNKEPKFKGGINGLDERVNKLRYSIGWKFGEVYVSGQVTDYYLENEAIEFIRVNYKEDPPQAMRVAVKLTNLGDEAWMAYAHDYPKNKNVSILIRKGSVVMVIYAVSDTLGKRFARYLVREIEKRDRGEP
jgi:hypothetical protein